MIQVEPDYCIVGTLDEIGKKLGEDLNGPGFYLTDDMTVLLIKNEPINRVWLWQPTLVDQYTAYVYQVTYSCTIYSCVSTAPIRLDRRVHEKWSR